MCADGKKQIQTQREKKEREIHRELESKENKTECIQVNNCEDENKVKTLYQFNVKRIEFLATNFENLSLATETDYRNKLK